MPNTSIKYYIVLFIFIITSHKAIANDTSLRNYALFNNGKLQMIVSDTWRDKTEQQLPHLPPTIVFTPLYGTSFHISISPFWAYKEGLVMPSLEDIEQLINIAAENAKEQAVEGSISISKFESTSNKGHYYSATDKAPKPGEYKYMTQGMIRVGELFVTFTILTNDDSIDITDEALVMLSNAEHVQSE
jgi:hypothetical protein